MTRIDFDPDNIQIRKIRKPKTLGGETVIESVITVWLPESAGVHRLRIPSGKSLAVDMSFEKIDPSRGEQHVVLKGAAVGGEVVVDLKNGRGIKKISARRDVFVSIQRLTHALESMHSEDRRPRRGW